MLYSRPWATALSVRMMRKNPESKASLQGPNREARRRQSHTVDEEARPPPRQIHRRVWYGVVATVILVSAGLITYGYNAISTQGQIEHGRSIYASVCAACHGQNLEGQENWRKPLPTGGFPAPPHNESGHTWHHPDEVLFRITKFGGQADASPGFRSNMPPFGEVLSDAEIWAVLAYIKNQWPQTIRARQVQIDLRHRRR